MSNEVSGYPGAPPGWYPDPAGGPGQRWWDGYDWTETTVEPSAPPPPPAPPPPTFGAPPPQAGPPPGFGYGGAPYPPQMVIPGAQGAQGLVGHELRVAPLARIAIAFLGVETLVNLVVWISHASQYRTYGHQLHVALQASTNGQTQQLPAFPDSGASSLVAFLAIIAIVIKCVWQYRAATAARAMHLPATHSPGWGVGSRFVPIVNFWMPYQAVRDCLAPSDPNRAVVLRWWLLAVGMDLGNILTIVGLLFSKPVGVTFAILSALCALAFLATAPKVVISIAAAHHAAVDQ